MYSIGSLNVCHVIYLQFDDEKEEHNNVKISENVKCRKLIAEDRPKFDNYYETKAGLLLDD